METLLEQQRRIHEERERLEKAMVDEMLHKKQSVSLRDTCTGKFCLVPLDLESSKVLFFFSCSILSCFSKSEEYGLVVE